MALDELKSDDEKFDDRGISYVIDRELLEKIKPVKVDYVTSAYGAGFKIDSSMSKNVGMRIVVQLLAVSWNNAPAGSVPGA